METFLHLTSVNVTGDQIQYSPPHSVIPEPDMISHFGFFNLNKTVPEITQSEKLNH